MARANSKNGDPPVTVTKKHPSRAKAPTRAQTAVTTLAVGLANNIQRALSFVWVTSRSYARRAVIVNGRLDPSAYGPKRAVGLTRPTRMPLPCLLPREPRTSEVRRIRLLSTSVHKDERARTNRPCPLEAIFRFPLSGSYLAVHPLQQRLALLVQLLVVAHQLQLLHRKVA